MKAGWKLQILPSFVFRDLSEYTFGKKRVWALSLGPCCATLPTWSDIQCCKPPPKTLTFSLRCAGTAAPATLILVDYLYVLYILYKVQSLLLHNPHFQHHIIHSDKLGLSHSGVRSSPLVGVRHPALTPPHLSSCRRPTAVWCFPWREEISAVTWEKCVKMLPRIAPFISPPPRRYPL